MARAPRTAAVLLAPNPRRDGACSGPCSVPKKTGQAQSLHEESVDERDVRSHRLAIQIETDRAFLVGAVGFHPSLLQPLQHFAPRMSVYISRADRNDRIARMNSRKQIGRSSARASMMPDLQQH